MYEGWSRAQIPTSDPEATINARHAGQQAPEETDRELQELFRARP